MNNNGIPHGILGIGTELPETILTNSDLEKMVDTSDEWIVKRTGISQRRILQSDIPASDMASMAARRAIDNAGIDPSAIDLIIVATSTPDYLTPSMACLVQKNIGAVNAAAFDLNGACTGFIYAMTVAGQFITNGYYRYILVIGCDSLSRVLDWEDRTTCVLFGDGAGAVLMGPVEEGYGILGTCIGAEGSQSGLITIPCTYSTEKDREIRASNIRTVRMDGSEVFKFAVRVIENATTKVLEKVKLLMDDIKLIVPHQANIRIIEGAAKRLGVSFDKVFSNIHKYGNISAASIPVALEEALKSKLIARGDHIVLVGFGGGLTWGSAVVRWSK